MTTAKYNFVEEMELGQYAMVADERHEYKLPDNASLNQVQAILVIVDGRDQSAFGMPHFNLKTWSVRGRSDKVIPNDCLKHSK